MGLITCPDCSNNISSEAPACPYCGKPMVQPVSQVNQRALAQRQGKVLGITLVSVLGVIYLFSKLPTETAFLAFIWLIIILSVGTIVLYIAGGLNAILNRKK